MMKRDFAPIPGIDPADIHNDRVSPFFRKFLGDLFRLHAAGILDLKIILHNPEIFLPFPHHAVFSPFAVIPSALPAAYCLMPLTATLCTIYFCRNRNIIDNGMALITATAILGP